MNETKLDTFVAEYEKHLTDAVMNHPDEYRYPLSEVPQVVARMRVAFAKNSFNKDGRAIKATCKALGIPYTYKGIRDYLEGKQG